MTADELDRLMRQRFGDDYRDKTIVGPVTSFRLRDAFEECGLRDPQAPVEPSESRGLWQTVPLRPYPPTYPPGAPPR